MSSKPCALENLPSSPAEWETGMADKDYFALYEWCLNPVLSLADILERLAEEAERQDLLDAAWQREECRINVYLLLAAACCITDDYLAYRPWNLGTVASALRRGNRAVQFCATFLNAPQALRSSLTAREIRRWRHDLDQCLDWICADLAGDPAHTAGTWTALRSGLRRLAAHSLPRGLLAWKMRIPEGFRCQDLAHQDVKTMAALVAQSFPPEAGPVLSVGPRTAGAYLAPLLNAYLRALGYRTLGWLTFRPKEGVTAAERSKLKGLLPKAARILLIDDHPNSGHTLAACVNLLRGLGADPVCITILAPEHPAQPDWKAAVRPTATLTVPSAEFYKQKLLDDDDSVLAILRQFYCRDGWESVQLERNAELDAANSRLASHYADGLHVRLKRVLQIRFCASGRRPVTKRVLAKSVGWGWLGYHACIAGERLSGFVPPLIGLRDGLLFMDWVGPLHAHPDQPDTERVLEVLPDYLAARVQGLRLRGDTEFAWRGRRWTGWHVLLAALGRPYGPYLRWLKTGVLRAEAGKYFTATPALTDGRMTWNNWVGDHTGLYKIDFEHHNFGGGEQDIVDTAYDLASAIYEFDLSEAEERALLERYLANTGDLTIHQRLPLYKILCGLLAMKAALYGIGWISSPERRQFWNQRYLSAQDFLTFHMARYGASRLPSSAAPGWTQRLLFLDIDGVLDWGYLGFPLMTPAGLLSLHALKASGYSPVLNTGRSTQHVREYCRIYGLPGGVAEYGSVFVDAIRGVELPLVYGEAREQLRECRDRLRELPGVFANPGYEYAVRAYRFGAHGPTGLPAAEIREFLEKHRFDRLAFLAGPADSCLGQMGVNKGTAMRAVKQYVGVGRHPIAAMGDSAADLEMLKEADIAYIPANHASELRQLRGLRECRALNQRLQRGLLAAVEDLIRRQGGPQPALHGVLADGSNRFIDALLVAYERSNLMQWLSVLNWRRL